jgi:hypothetical protein
MVLKAKDMEPWGTCILDLCSLSDRKGYKRAKLSAALLSFFPSVDAASDRGGEDPVSYSSPPTEVKLMPGKDADARPDFLKGSLDFLSSRGTCRSSTEDMGEERLVLDEVRRSQSMDMDDVSFEKIEAFGDEEVPDTLDCRLRLE